MLDVSRRSLELQGREVTLRPQAMEVLCYLAQNPGRPISKEEIFREVWPGIVVTDDSLFVRYRFQRSGRTIKRSEIAMARDQAGSHRRSRRSRGLGHRALACVEMTSTEARLWGSN
jgi:hypothetical protein